MARAKTKEVKISDIAIGGNNPIAIQSMYDKDILSLSYDSLVNELKELRVMGCDIFRITYNRPEIFDCFKAIVDEKIFPIVADIHFDYKLALQAIKTGCAKIRINPGNIGQKWKVKEILQAAKDSNIAIRIGLNSGSLPVNTKGLEKAQLMAESALEYANYFYSEGFEKIVVSLKSSNIEDTIKSNMIFSKQSDIPLHLGLTEAGTLIASVSSSTYALSKLLDNGIGDTIRVSIAGSLEDEIRAGKQILNIIGHRLESRVIACPRCGRSSYNNIEIATEIEREISKIKKDRAINIAVMGCLVNGPGEAKAADLAVVGNGEKVYIYIKGKMVEETNQRDVVSKVIKIYERI